MDSKYCFLDLETEGLVPFKNKLHGIGIALDDAEPQYFAANAVPQWVLDAIANPKLIKVGSNIRGFDGNFLTHQSVEVGGDFYDTGLFSQVLNDSFREHGLKQITARNFGKEFLSEKTELDRVLGMLKMKHVGLLCALDLELGNGGPGPHFDLIARYCCEDVSTSRMNFYKLKADLEAQHKQIRSINKTAVATPLTYLKNEIIPAERTFLELEKSGIRVDPAVLADIKTSCEALRSELLTQFQEICANEIVAIEKELLHEALSVKKSVKGKASVLANPAKYGATFNSASGFDMANLIYDKLNCPAALVKRTKKGTRSTREDDLNLVQASAEEGSKLSEVLEIYNDIKKINKTTGTYVGNEEKGISSLLHKKPDGTTWIYPRYAQRTMTGRAACFPCQQLPNSAKNKHAARIKRFFIPSTPDHCFVYADWSLIEMVFAAHVSQDEALLNIFKTGRDPHYETASAIFRIPREQVTKVQRTAAKPVNYLTIFGGGEGRLMMELALKNRLKFSKQECAQFIKAFFEKYAGYKAHLDGIKSFVETNGYVSAENGRIRHLEDAFFGKYLDATAKVFFGPPELRNKLLSTPGEKIHSEELFWRANGRYKHALNAAYNFPIQSLAGSLMKAALRAAAAHDLQLRASIHDCLIVECLKTEALETAAKVTHIMENTMKISCPIRAEVKILQSFDESDTYLPHP